MTRGSWRTASGRPGYILSHGELAATGSAGQLSKDSALLPASYLGGASSSG